MPIDRIDADVFNARIAAWQAWQEAPWGRLRYRVVHEVLRRTLAALGSGPLRVLDVGGGDGGDAVPLALAGHRVTIVDYSEPLLREARERTAEHGVDTLRTICADLDELPRLGLGGFDLVLCHSVLHYREDTAATLALLTPHVAPGGALSVLAPNPVADVLRAAIRSEDPRAAVDLLSAEHFTTETFRHEVRRVSAEEAQAALLALGLGEIRRFGIRAVTDYIVNEQLKYDPEFYAELERLELALHDREPYLRTARIWQLVARRPAGGPPG